MAYESCNPHKYSGAVPENQTEESEVRELSAIQKKNSEVRELELIPDSFPQSSRTSLSSVWFAGITHFSGRSPELLPAPKPHFLGLV